MCKDIRDNLYENGLAKRFMLLYRKYSNLDLDDVYMSEIEERECDVDLREAANILETMRAVMDFDETDIRHRLISAWEAYLVFAASGCDLGCSTLKTHFRKRARMLRDAWVGLYLGELRDVDQFKKDYDEWCRREGEIIRDMVRKLESGEYMTRRLEHDPKYHNANFLVNVLWGGPKATDFSLFN